MKHKLKKNFFFLILSDRMKLKELINNICIVHSSLTLQNNAKNTTHKFTFDKV